MSRPILRSNLEIHPSDLPRTDDSFFGRVADAINTLLFPRAMANAQTRASLLQSAHLLSPTPALSSRRPAKDQVQGPAHEVQSFLEEFFNQVGIKYFETTLIRKLSSAIAEGVREGAELEAEKIAEFFIKENENNPPNLSDPKVAQFTNQALSYLFSFCPDQKKGLIAAAVRETYRDEVSAVILDYLAEKNCALLELTVHLPRLNQVAFLKKLGQQLIPFVIRNDEVMHAFETSLAETLVPFLNRAIQDNKGITPLIKLLIHLCAKVGSERFAHLYESLPLKEILDQLIQKANLHLDAYIEADGDLQKFAEHTGCQPLTKKIIQDDPDAEQETFRFFEQFSNDLLQVLLRDDVLDEIVVQLRGEEERMGAMIDHPLAKEMLNIFLREENQKVVTDALKSLRPFLSEAMGKWLRSAIFDTLLPSDKIHTFLFDTIAPGVHTLLYRGIVENLIRFKLHNNAAFMAAFEEQNDEKMKTALRSAYHKEFNEVAPDEIEEAIIPVIRNFVAILNRRGGDGTLKARFAELLRKGYTGEKVATYSELLNKLIFHVSRINIVSSLLGNIAQIKNYLGDLFLFGVEDIRGPQGHQMLFSYLREALNELKKPETVQKLFEQPPKILPEDELNKRIGVESELMGRLITQIVQIPQPLGAKALNLKIKDHLAQVLRHLFSETTHNLNVVEIGFRSIQTHLP